MTTERTRSDYAELKRRVHEAGLLDKDPGFNARSMVYKLLLLGASLAAFVVFHDQGWVIALDAVALGLVFGQLGFQMHDAGHRQMFEHSAFNVAIGLFTGNVLLGMSYGWWVDKHNRHHANPNHVDMDPDIGPGVVSYSEETAIASKGVHRFVARYQAYMFFGLLLLLAFAMHSKSVKFLATRQSKYRRLEIGLLALHAVLFIGFFVLVLGPWWAIAAIVIQQAVGGAYMGLVFAPNHKGMPQLEPGSDVDFLRRQVLTSRNVRSHPVTDVCYGALNYQVEHHLFPTMSRSRVRQAHKIVRRFCEERGIPYHQTSVLTSYREILGFLHQVGAPLRAKTLRPGADGRLG